MNKTKKWIRLFALLSLCAACSQKPQTEAAAGADTDQGDQADSSAEELIIGGHAITKKNEISSTTVSLLDTQQGTLCTASILSDEVAITAAHCVSGNPEAMQLSFGPRTSGHEARPVIEVAVSPSWERNQREQFNTGDVALVHFSGGLPAGIIAASLMKATHHLSDGEIVTLAGFGISSGSGGGDGAGAGKLRTVDIKIANAHYSTTEVSLDQTQHQGACHGDSGGPAFVQNNGGGLLLWGITSRGINDPTDRCVGDSVYTRIQPYVRWMNTVIRSWGKHGKNIGKDKDKNKDQD